MFAALDVRGMPARSAKTAPRTRTAMIASADLVCRDAVLKVLTSYGYRNVVAEKSADALMLLRQGGIDLVIVPVRGAICDGVEVLQLVREAVPGMPVIVLALGANELEDNHLGRLLGFKDCGGRSVHARELLASLTGREREILDLIVAGLTNKAIARELKISPRTVENHRARVMEKLHVRSVVELVRVALCVND